MVLVSFTTRASSFVWENDVLKEEKTKLKSAFRLPLTKKYNQSPELNDEAGQLLETSLVLQLNASSEN